MFDQLHPVGGAGEGGCIQGLGHFDGHMQAVFGQGAGLCGLVWGQTAIGVLVAITRRDGGGQAHAQRAAFKAQQLGVVDLDHGLVARQEVAQIGGVQVFA